MDGQDHRGPLAAVEACGLGKTFPRGGGLSIRALDDIRFVLPVGTFAALLGPNGAGKTTLLRLLATVIRPTAGDARILGRSLVHEPGWVRRHNGFVSAQTGLVPRLTAGELLVHFGELQGLTRRQARERTHELATLLDLEQVLGVRCGQLSTGQSRRVSLARALMHRPRVLLLDEPAAGLDLVGTAVLYRHLDALRRGGATILMSTHSVSDAHRLCDHLIVLDGGRVRGQGPPAEVEQWFGAASLQGAWMGRAAGRGEP
jgi:ABC-type multidrug transport system ATPase subunit